MPLNSQKYDLFGEPEIQIDAEISFPGLVISLIFIHSHSEFRY